MIGLADNAPVWDVAVFLIRSTKRDDTLVSLSDHLMTYPDAVWDFLRRYTDVRGDSKDPESPLVVLLREATIAPAIEPLKTPSGMTFPYPAAPADAIRVMYNYFNVNSVNFEVPETDAVLFVMSLLSVDTYLFDILQENIVRLQLDMYPVRVAAVKGPTNVLTMQFVCSPFLKSSSF